MAMKMDRVYIYHPRRQAFLHYIAYHIPYWTPSARLAQPYYKLGAAHAMCDRLGEGCRLVSGTMALKLERESIIEKGDAI